MAAAYYLISSSFSGKLQKAMRSCSCSGMGCAKRSTSSKGMWQATAWADSSTKGSTRLSEITHSNTAGHTADRTTYVHDMSIHLAWLDNNSKYKTALQTDKGWVQLSNNTATSWCRLTQTSKSVFFLKENNIWILCTPDCRFLTWLLLLVLLVLLC